MFRRFALLALISLALSANATTDSKPIAVGQAADLSGPSADFGRDYSLGAKIYFDHINATGGVAGHRIVYRSRDTAGIPANGVAAARELIKGGADVLFGITGDDTVEAVARDAAVRQSSIPLFAPVAGNTHLGVDDNVYYIRSSVAREIQVTMAHLANLGIKTFAIATGDEHGREAAKALEDEAARHGARVVIKAALSPNGDAPSRAATLIAQSRPQAVFVVGDTLAVAQFFKRYRQLDPGAFLCAPSLVNVRTLISAIGPQAARGVIVSQVVPDPGTFSEVTREHKKLMEKYADEPASQATLEGFIAAKALVQGLQRSREGAAGLGQAIRADGHFDIGGYTLQFMTSRRASDYVELTVIDRNGHLLR